MRCLGGATGGRVYPRGRRRLESLARLAQVGLDQPPRRARQPPLGDHLVEVLHRYLVQPHEDRRVAVEVRRGEEHAGPVGEQRLLRADVLDPRAQDRSVRSVVAERLDFLRAQRTLPHEQFVVYAPLTTAARDAFIGLGQRERDPAYVLPGGHYVAHTSSARLCPSVLSGSTHAHARIGRFSPDGRDQRPGATVVAVLAQVDALPGAESIGATPRTRWPVSERSIALRSQLLLSQPERSSLGVLTDRPSLPGVDDASAERLHSL